MKKIFTILLLLCCVELASAQDKHFSQYNLSPMTTNPALTGQFNGCFRMNALYRNQWATILGKSAFNTYAASMDMAILKEQLKGSFFSVGLNFFNDQAGDLHYGTKSIAFNLAYCQILQRKKPMTLSAGFQIGNWQKQLDLSQARFEVPTANIQNGVSFMDFGAGVVFYHQPNNFFSYQVGVSGMHLNSANQSFVHYTDNIGKKLQLHATTFIQASDAFTVIPSMLLIRQAKASEMNLTCLAKVLIDDNGKYETAVYFGLGTRVARPGIDATIAYFRFSVANLTVGLAYDINVSQLHEVSKSQGGPEIGLQYTIKCPESKTTIYNKKKKLYCPKF